MKKYVMILMTLMTLSTIGVAQGFEDDLYYIPTKEKPKAESTQRSYSFSNSSSTPAIRVPDEAVNSRDVDEYNRRYSSNDYNFSVDQDTLVATKKRAITADNGYWVDEFQGTESDYENAQRIIRFRSPRYAVHISSPYYWDLAYGGYNSWDWNVYVDGSYAYAFPTFSNRLWFDYNYGGWGMGWGYPYYGGYYGGGYGGGYWGGNWGHGHGGSYYSNIHYNTGRPNYGSSRPSSSRESGNYSSSRRSTTSSGDRMSSTRTSSNSRVIGTRETTGRVSTESSRRASTGTSTRQSSSTEGLSRETYTRPSSTREVSPTTTPRRSSSSESAPTYNRGSAPTRSESSSSSSSSRRSSDNSSSRSSSSGSSYSSGSSSGSSYSSGSSSRSSGGSSSGGGSSRSSSGGSRR